MAEPTQLLVENVDMALGWFAVRLKLWLLWNVKTGRERRLPLTPETRALFAEAVGSRSAGFMCVGPAFEDGARMLPAFRAPAAFRASARRLADLAAENPGAGDRDRKRAAFAFCRAPGQVPDKTVRLEFMKLTRQIGSPEFTRVRDLRHFFASRAQAAGVNPILPGHARPHHARYDWFRSRAG